MREQHSTTTTTGSGTAGYGREHLPKHYTAADERAAASWCPPRSTTASLLGVVGSAGIGAFLMYLLDPDKGPQRRHHLAETTAHAAEGAADAIAPVWSGAKLIGHSVAERAKYLGESVAEGAHSAGGYLSERTSDAGRGLRRGSRRAAKSTSHAASSLWEKPRSWFREEEETSYVPGAGATASAIAALAAGVGIMYLMDPTDGNRRRKLLADKCTRFANEAGDFFRKTGRHLANKSRGVQHRAAGMVQHGERPTDRQLAERVRATVGHFGLRANYDVLAENGRVTLIGQCATDDVDRLLGAVHSVPGVVAIVNQLDVRPDFDPGRQAGGIGSGGVGMTNPTSAATTAGTGTGFGMTDTGSGGTISA
jgi:hypothetical protein